MGFLLKSDRANYIEKIQKTGSFQAADLIRRLIVSGLLAVLIELLLLPRELHNLAVLDGLTQMSFLRVILVTFAVTVLLSVISRFVKMDVAERWGIVAVFVVIAGITVSSSFSQPYLMACILLVCGFLLYGIKGWNGGKVEMAKPGRESGIYKWIVLVCAVFFFLFVSAWTVGRVYSFSTPTYDFGIFAQMFYNMKESGLPLTTVERDGLLSHFCVHVSPIYYLLLPFYWLVPHPAILQVLQAAVITSAVIPLWKIGKEHGLSAGQRMLVCLMLFLYPAFSGGTSYDIHENCFLIPLLLWLFYGIDKKNIAITAVSAVLTLMVKEDAAVYVAVIALFLIVKNFLRLQEKEYGELLTGVALFLMSIIWFFLVTGYLAELGDGVMTYRYNNFIYDGSGSLFTVIKAVIMNPMKAVYECCDLTKMDFIKFTMLSLLGIPLLTRRYERLILAIPYVLVNLMSDYQYQHDIFFQYTFGSTACLMYLFIINFADMKIPGRKKNYVLIFVVLVNALFFHAFIYPKAIVYPTRSIQAYDYYENFRDALEEIPKEASVTAATFYTTWLSQREFLYDIRYASKEHVLETEYVVLKKNSTGDFGKYTDENGENGYENLTALLEENGYELYNEVNDVLVIYYRPK